MRPDLRPQEGDKALIGCPVGEWMTKGLGADSLLFAFSSAGLGHSTIYEFPLFMVGDLGFRG